MKKFVVIMAALLLVLAMGTVSFAYPVIEDGDINFTVTINKEDGSVTFAHDGEQAFIDKYLKGGTLQHLFVYIAESKIDFSGKKLEEGSTMIDGPYNNATAGPNNVGRVDERTVTVKLGDKTGTDAKGTGAYKFEEGKTYYAYLMINATGANPDWAWTAEPVEFVYTTSEEPTTPEQPGTDDPDNGGDFSAIAYAAAALAGCGALVIRKKK